MRSIVACLIAAAVAVSSPILEAAGAKKEWITLPNCELVPNRDNDGDSFHIKSEGTEYLVRLYMVDAPETKGGQMAGRLIEQATYFGLSVPDVIQLGQNAKLFVENKLSQPFTVQTRKAAGLGRSNIERFYAFVQTRDGDLGQLLVANGLARVHGTHAARPGATSSAEELDNLKKLEEQAKQARVGGWSGKVAASAPAVVAATSPQVPRISSTQPAAIQTPVRPAIPPRPAIQPTSATVVTTTVPGIEKLDVNSATREQLEKIPGIGPALSERIVAARPFRNADDLKKVKGVGEGKRYEQLRPYFK